MRLQQIGRFKISKIGSFLVALTACMGLFLPAMTLFAPPPGGGNGNGNGGGNGGGGGGSAPPAVIDLLVTGATYNTITLQWTAPGDANFTASAYDIRYLIGESIDDTNWDEAWLTYSVVDLEPVPQPGGSLETVAIPHLAGNQEYHFAIRVIDSKDKVSAFSNPVSAMTTIAPSGAWDLELVAQAWVSGNADFAFDPTDGQISIIYQDWLSNTVWFAHFNGIVWESEIVLQDVTYVPVLLEYDAVGRAKMLIHGVGIDGMLYGVRDAGAWTIEQVTSLLVNGGVADLVLDAAGNPHVLFDELVETGHGNNSTRFTNLHYAFRDGAGWQTEHLATTDFNSFLKASIVLDTSGNAIVAYSLREENTGDSVLNLTTRDEFGNWTTETVKNFATGHASDNSVGIDPITGWPLIAYRLFDSTNRTLKLARFDGMDWQIELVDAIALSINDAQLRFDPSGTAVIAYENHNSAGGTSSVLLARDNNGVWDIETVAEDNPFAVGMGVANLRFDTDGNALILFEVDHGVPFFPRDELFLTWRAP